MLNLFSLKINLDFNNLKFTFAAILCNKGDPKICLKKRNLSQTKNKNSIISGKSIFYSTGI